MVRKSWFELEPDYYLYLMRGKSKNMFVLGGVKRKKEGEDGWGWVVGGGKSPVAGTLEWAKIAIEGTFNGVDTFSKVNSQIRKGIFRPLNVLEFKNC